MGPDIQVRYVTDQGPDLLRGFRAAPEHVLQQGRKRARECEDAEPSAGSDAGPATRRLRRQPQESQAQSVLPVAPGVSLQQWAPGYWVRTVLGVREGGLIQEEEV